MNPSFINFHESHFHKKKHQSFHDEGREGKWKSISKKNFETADFDLFFHSRSNWFLLNTLTRALEQETFKRHTAKKLVFTFCSLFAFAIDERLLQASIGTSFWLFSHQFRARRYWKPCTCVTPDLHATVLSFFRAERSIDDFECVLDCLCTFGKNWVKNHYFLIYFRKA